MKPSCYPYRMRKDWRIHLGTMRERPIRDYSRGELAVAVLAVIAGAVVVVGAASAIAVAPGLGALLKIFKPKNKAERLRLRRALSSLERKGMLQQKKGAGGTSFKATAKGISHARYDALRIRKTRWDRKWRFCMFDIPEKHKGARVVLGRKVIDMGMRHFQKSVFISPYPCEKEFRSAAAFLGVEEYVQFVEAERISNEGRFKKEFGR